VLQTIDDVAKGDIRTKIRDMLGAFLFKGDDVEKKVKVLSGGERSRLALVKLLLEPYNVLVLDEPTNHLDMRSKDILKQALIKFDGTIIVVSHDRDFLDGIVEKVFEFRHNRIKENIGGIYDFLRKKKIENLKDIEKKDKIREVNRKDDFSVNKQRYLDKKESEKTLRRLRKRLEETETSIESIERELASMDRSMIDPLSSTPEDEGVYKNYQELKVKLNEEMNKWTAYSDEVEKFLSNTEG
jgi:ATP-binding cassette subfamily F protein 3